MILLTISSVLSSSTIHFTLIVPRKSENVEILELKFKYKDPLSLSTKNEFIFDGLTSLYPFAELISTNFVFFKLLASSENISLISF